MNMKRLPVIMVLPLFFAGCATGPIYLVPSTESAQPGKKTFIYNNTDGRPCVTKYGQNADVLLTTNITTGNMLDPVRHLGIFINVHNKSQESLDFGPNDVMVLNALNTLVSPADVREMVYRRHGVTPPEQKSASDNMGEQAASAFSLGVSALSESNLQSQARNEYAYIMGHALKQASIPAGVKAEGWTYYLADGLLYPVTVVVSVKGEKFEFEFTRP